MPESLVPGALRKCSPHDGKVWAGYLQPVEIIALVEAGAVPSDEYKVEEAKKDIKAGRGGGSWFYFELGSLKPHGLFDTHRLSGTNGYLAHQRHCKKNSHK